MANVFQKWPFDHAIVWQGPDDDVGTNVPRFDELVDATWKPYDLPEIAHYLSIGFLQGGIVGEKRARCPVCRIVDYFPSVRRSDGVWSWPDLLSHLVELHSIRIPDAFLLHIRERLKENHK